MKHNTYRVGISTGGEPLANLYPNISLQICGMQGHSEVIPLESRDIFALDVRCTETFVFELPDFGTLTQCWIGYEIPANAEAIIRTVRIHDSLTRREWVFEFPPQAVKPGIGIEWISAEAQSARPAVAAR